MPVLLKSRLPEITMALPLKAGAALMAGAERIAEDAKSRAPVAAETLYFKNEAIPPGTLRDSIRVDTGDYIEPGNERQRGKGWDESLIQGGVGIMAAWWYRYPEYGTSRQPAQPFLVPAAEAHKDELAASVSAALKAL